MATPGGEQDTAMDPRKVQEHFEDFYEDLFEELSKHGEIESLNVCDNVADHMVGNVYVNFREEEQAAAALQALAGRFYAGRPILADFSPVTDFREATCRQYEENTCNRGGYCNFMHLRKISRPLREKLFGSRRRSRSRSPPRGGDDYRDRRGRHDNGRGYGGRGGRGRYDRYDDRDGRYGGRGGDRDRERYGRRDRSRSRSPDHRRGGRSPVREGSEERRAKIEQWNREKEERDRGERDGRGGSLGRDGGGPDGDGGGYRDRDDDYGPQ